MKKRNRLFAVLMAIMMVVTYMPGLAYAAAEDEAEPDPAVTTDIQDEAEPEEAEATTHAEVDEPVEDETPAESTEPEVQTEEPAAQDEDAEPADGDPAAPEEPEYREIDSIEFEPANGPLELIEGVYGEIAEDENGDEYFRYDLEDFPCFENGDQLTVKYADSEESYIYTYHGYDDVGEMVFAREDGDGYDFIYADDFEYESNQTGAWTAGEEYSFTISLRGAETEYPVVVVESPVKAISFSRGYSEEHPIELTEGVDGYFESGESVSRPYFYYYMKYAVGDVLTVTKEADGEEIETEYTLEASDSYSGYGDFISEDGDSISVDDLREISNQNYDNQWTPGNDEPYVLTLKYFGASCDVYVNVVSNDVESISFSRPDSEGEPLKIFKEEDDYYYFPFELGDVLQLKYFNQDDPYIYTLSSGEYDNYFRLEGDAPAGVPVQIATEDIEKCFNDIEGQPDCTEWEVGETYNIELLYMNRTCSVPVIVTTENEGPDDPDPQLPVYALEFSRANGMDHYELYENENMEKVTDYIDGEEVTYERYERPLFEDGDQLTVYETEDSAGTVYTYDRHEWEFLDDSGNRLDEEWFSYRTNESYSNRWEYGGEGYYLIISYGDKSVNVPVTIIRPDFDSIEYERADGSTCFKLVENLDGSIDSEGYYDDNDEWVERKYFRYAPYIDEGDKLTVRKISEDTVEDTVYVYGYDEEDEEWLFINTDDPSDRISDEKVRLQYDHEQSFEHPWEVDGVYGGKINYCGKTSVVTFEIVRNPIASIEYITKDGKTSYDAPFECRGHYSDDENGNIYFYYNYPEFKVGDVFKVKYRGIMPDTKTYEYRENSDGYYAFVNQDDADDEISQDDFDFTSDQDTNHWVMGGTGYHFTMAYKGVTLEIPVTIVENPVTGISFSRPESGDYITLMKGRDSFEASDNDNVGNEHKYTKYDFLFEEGDLFTVTVNDEEIVYKYIGERERFVNTEDPEDYFYAYSDIDWDSDQGLYYDDDTPVVNEWKPGETHQIILKYMGKITEVPVLIQENPVKEVSFVRPSADGQPIELEYGVDVDEYGNIDFRYQEDDEFYVTLNSYNEPVKYVAKAYSSGYVYAFVAEGEVPEILPESIEPWNIQWENLQNPKIGDNGSMTCSFNGVTGEVDYVIIANPVESFQFVRDGTSGAISLREGVDGGNWSDGEGKNYFGYYINYREGDKLIVKYKASDDPVQYIYKEEEDSQYFEAASAPDGMPLIIKTDWLEQNSDQRYENAWQADGTDHQITFKYNGCEYSVDVHITASPVDSITFTRDGVNEQNPLQLIKHVDGSESDNGIFQYWLNYVEGDVLTVVYNDGRGTVRYLYQSGIGFVNENESEDIIEPDQENNSYEEEWQPEDETPHIIYIEYEGKRAEVPVIVVENNPVESIEFIPAGAHELVFEQDGEYDDKAGFFRYYNCWFLSGDKIIVNYNDGTANEYVFDTEEKWFVDSTGSLLDYNMYAESEQTEEWTLGSTHEQVFRVLGRTASITVTIVPSAEVTYRPAKASTCMEQGNIEYWTKEGKYYADEACTQELDEDEVFLPLAEHTHGATGRENEVAPSCETSGYYEEVVYCTVCGEEISREAVTIPAKGHSYGPWQSVDENQHRRVCTNDSSHDEVADHTWNEGDVTTAPTEESEGVRTYTCTACGAEKTEAIPALEHHHELIKIDAVEATCQSEGNTEYWICSKCGKHFSDEAGENEMENDSWIVAPVDHDYILHEREESGCNTQGHEAYWECSSCHKLFRYEDKTEEISLTDIALPVDENAHNWGDWVYYDEYSHRRTCSTCNEHEDAYHEWDEGVVTKEATAYESGIMTYTCSVCGGTKTEQIGSLNVWDVTTGTYKVPYGPNDDYKTISLNDIIRINVAENDERYPDLIFDWRDANGDKEIESNADGSITVPCTDERLCCYITDAKTGEYQSVYVYLVRDIDYNVEVTGFEFQRYGKDYLTIDEYSSGETTHEGYWGEDYFRYNVPIFQEGDKVILHTRGDGDRVYEYKTDPYGTTGYRSDYRRFEYTGPDGVSDVISLNDFSWASNQSESNQWKPGDALGKDIYYCYYRGVQEEVQVVIRQTITNVRSIEYRTVDGKYLDIKNKSGHGETYTDENGNSNVVWIYSMSYSNFNEGDQIILNGTDVYTLVAHSWRWYGANYDNQYYNFYNEETGVRFAANIVDVDAESKQSLTDPWMPGDDNRECIISAFGASTTAPVRVWGDGLLWIEEQEATCTSDGVRGHWEDYDGKLYSDFGGNNEVTEADLVIPAEHKWKEIYVDPQPTAEEYGTMHYQCSLCYALKTESIEKIDHTHNLVKVDAKPPICEEPGNTDYWKCTECGRLFEDGSGTVMTTLSRVTVTDNPVHEEYSPWRAYDNYAHYRNCLACNKLEKQEHEWNEGTVLKEATTTEKGEIKYTCSVCGYSYIQTTDRLDDPDAGYGIAALPDESEITELKEGQNIDVTGMGDGQVHTFYFIPESSEIKYDAGLLYTRKSATSEYNYWISNADICIFTDSKRIDRFDSSIEERRFNAGTKYYIQFRYERPAYSGADKYYLVFGMHDYSIGEVPEDVSEIHLGDEWTISGATARTVYSYKFVPQEDIKVEMTAATDGDDNLSLDIFLPGITSYTGVGSSGNAKLVTSAKLKAGKVYYAQVCMPYCSDRDTADINVSFKEYLAPPLAEIDPDSPELTLGKKSTAVFENTGDVVTFKFVPEEDGQYIFKSYKDAELSQYDNKKEGAICLIDRRLEDYTDNQSSYSNFNIVFDAKAGTTYYLQCKYWAVNVKGAYDVSVDKYIPEHTHVAGEPVRENEVPATCTEDGSYDEVVYCTLYGEEMSRRTVNVPAINHDWNAPEYTWADDDKSVTAARTCKNDASHVETETVPVVLTVTEPATINSSGKGVLTADFKNPGFETQTKPVDIPKLDHEHSLKKVSAVAATCTDPGNDEYWVCTAEDCGRYFSDENGTTEIINHDSVILPATGHEPGDVVHENEVAATCAKEGSYDEVVYCKKCNTELSRESKTIAIKPHTPGSAIRENETQATCTRAGGYDEVVYCKVCNEELSREHTTVPMIDHTPADPVRENEVAATCTTDGRYDEVTYCTACRTELSRTTKSIPALGHHWGIGVIEKRATESEPGSLKYTCTVCGETRTETIPQLEPEAEPINAAAEAAIAAAENAYETGTVAAAEQAANDAAAAAASAVSKAEMALEAAAASTDEDAVNAAIQDLADAKASEAKAQAVVKKVAAKKASAKATAAKAAASSAAVGTTDAVNKANAAVSAATEAANAAQQAVKEAKEALEAVKSAGYDTDSEEYKAAAKAVTDAETSKKIADSNLTTAKSALTKAKAEADAAKAAAAAAKAAEDDRQGIPDSSLPKVKIKKPAAKKTSITVKWTKLTKKQLKKSKATHYEIWVSESSSYPAGATTKEKIVKKSKSSWTCKGLKKNKKYYVKVRAIKYVGGKKHVGAWKKKTIKTKKK